MNTKGTTILLQVGERVESFEIEHAERILRMPNNGGWRIADNERFELTDNGFKPRKDKDRVPKTK